MSIPTKLEPKSMTDGFGSVLEKCVFCGARTNRWHVPTNTPVCVNCAASKSVTDIPKKR